MRLTCELIISCVYLLALLIKRIEWVLRQERRFIASSAPPVLLHIVSNGPQLFLKRERVRRTHTDKWSGVTLVEFWIAGYKKLFLADNSNLREPTTVCRVKFRGTGMDLK